MLCLFFPSAFSFLFSPPSLSPCVYLTLHGNTDSSPQFDFKVSTPAFLHYLTPFPFSAARVIQCGSSPAHLRHWDWGWFEEDERRPHLFLVVTDWCSSLGQFGWYEKTSIVEFDLRLLGLKAPWSWKRRCRSEQWADLGYLQTVRQTRSETVNRKWWWRQHGLKQRYIWLQGESACLVVVSSCSLSKGALVLFNVTVSTAAFSELEDKSFT